MRLVFMGTGEIALPTLRWLIGQTDHPLVGVWTQPDKPVGRDQVLTPPEVKTLALAAGIPVFQPETFRKNPDAVEALRALEPDVAIVMAYGQILPRTVIATPRIACVNLHASLLPRHRGASPIQAAIREGDTESGITLMHVVPALDAGDMILKHTLPISPDDTGGTLHDKLAALGPGIVAEGLPLLASGTAPREPQSEAQVTHCGKLGREDGEIDWSRPAAEVARLVRAYDPWPGTTALWPTDRGPVKLKIFPPVAVAVFPMQQGLIGEVTLSDRKDTLLVRCGDGAALEIRGDVQLEGRKRLPVADFLRGQSMTGGLRMG